MANTQLITEQALFLLPYASMLATGLALLIIGGLATPPERLWMETPLLVSKLMGAAQLILMACYLFGLLGNHYVKVYSTYMHFAALFVLPFVDMQIWLVVMGYFWIPQIAYLVVAIAFTSISEIVPGVLYLGNAKAATQKQVLRKYQITQVIELHDGRKQKNPNEVDAELLQLLCSDDLGSKDSILAVAPQAVAVLERAAAKSKKEGITAATLIHCSAGVSRSSAMVVYCLISTDRCQSVHEAYALVVSKRRIVDVSVDHISALQDYFHTSSNKNKES